MILADALVAMQLGHNFLQAEKRIRGAAFDQRRKREQLTCPPRIFATRMLSTAGRGGLSANISDWPPRGLYSRSEESTARG